MDGSVVLYLLVVQVGLLVKGWIDGAEVGELEINRLGAAYFWKLSLPICAGSL